MSTRLCPRAAIHRSALATVSIQPGAARAPAAVLRGPVAPPRREQRSLFTPIRPRVCALRCCRRRTYHYYTDVERNAERVLQTATSKVEEFDRASKALSEGSGVQEAIGLTKIMKDLGGLRNAWDEYNSLRQQLEEIASQLSDPDPEVREMFSAEHQDLCAQLDTLVTDRLPLLLLPTPETFTLPLIMSLNAGVGGAEATMCVEMLARMYQRFAAQRGWQTEIVSSVDGAEAMGSSGLKEITMKFSPPAYGGGEGEAGQVFGLLQWEKGVHRVQRVPVNDSQGRVQSSTIAIVVLPIYPDRPDAPLVDPKDVKTEVMRSRGAGGQHVNKTESAVRLTHAPTGITVSMQDSRSQHQNREWAWEILRARLSERKHQQEVERKRASRRSQVKGANLGDKVRTYNFTQDRVTDHRINVSWGNIGDITDGEGFIRIVDELKQDFRNRRLDALLAGEEDIDE